MNDSSELITCWTMQDAEMFWAAYPSRPVQQRMEVDPDLRSAYLWMTDRLRARCPAPPHVVYPLWFWIKAHSHRAKPDLRTRGWDTPGLRQVLVTCQIPRRLVLQSDFQKWHMVLNRAYLSSDSVERSLYERLLACRLGVTEDDYVHFTELPDDIRELVRASWERVFRLSDESDCWEPVAERQIQGVTWELRPEWVTHVREFTTR